MSLNEKVVVISGAASGIGRATARVLAGSGAKVSLADVQKGPLDELIAEIRQSGGVAIGMVVDVRNRAQVEDWIRKTVSEFGKLYGAANIAGVAGKGLAAQAIQDVDDDEWAFVFEVNVKGVLNSLRAQIPQIADGGSIINVASLAGITGSPRSATYTASKHAVVGLSRVAARELGVRNIRVNVVCPGPVDTPLLNNIRPEDVGAADAMRSLSCLGRNGKPEEVARLIEWLLSPHSSYVTGASQVIDGGFHCQ